MNEREKYFLKFEKLFKEGIFRINKWNNSNNENNND